MFCVGLIGAGTNCRRAISTRFVVSSVCQRRHNIVFAASLFFTKQRTSFSLSHDDAECLIDSVNFRIAFSMLVGAAKTQIDQSGAEPQRVRADYRWSRHFLHARRRSAPELLDVTKQDADDKDRNNYKSNCVLHCVLGG